MTNWEELTLFEPPPGTTKPKPGRWQDVPYETVLEVFTVWQDVHGKRRAKLSPERVRKIAQAVVSHGVVVVLEAVRGCVLSEWHMGRNPQRKRYDDIGLILRNAEKIEYFSDLYQAQNNAGGFLDNI